MLFASFAVAIILYSWCSKVIRNFFWYIHKLLAYFRPSSYSFTQCLSFSLLFIQPYFSFLHSLLHSLSHSIFHFYFIHPFIRSFLHSVCSHTCFHACLKLRYRLFENVLTSIYFSLVILFIILRYNLVLFTFSETIYTCN